MCVHTWLERSLTGVLGALGDISSVPLTDTRTAGVGQNHTAELLEGLELTITLDGGANLLGTGSDSEESLGLDAVVESVLGDGGGTAHVLVGGVGARADQTDLELLRPAVGLDGILELGDGGGQIGSERTVNVRLELGQVDLQELVVLGALVFAELLGVEAGEVTNVGTLGGGEVVVHAVVEGEDGGGGTNFSTHVANGTHTSGGEGVDTRTVVFDDGTGTTLDGQVTSDAENDIWPS